jgi:hypothetical protein
MGALSTQAALDSEKLFRLMARWTTSLIREQKYSSGDRHDRLSEEW